jgi:hypothetical protein
MNLKILMVLCFINVFTISYCADFPIPIGVLDSSLPFEASAVLPEGPRATAGETQLLTFKQIFRVLNPGSEGTYADNSDPHVLVFSIPDDEKKEIRIAVNKALVSKYSEIIRALYDGEDDLKGPIPLINSENPLFQNIRLETFQTLMKLLFTYDENSRAYNNGQNFDITADNIPALLNLANYLFANNMMHQWGAVFENDLGFFHALLRSCFSFIFDPQSLVRSQEQAEDASVFRLSLPFNIDDTALHWAKPNELYVFYKTLIKLSENEQITLDQEAFNFLEKLNAYFTHERLFRSWSELRSFSERSDEQQQAFDELSQQFISFLDITDRPVSQMHISISHSDLSQNTSVLYQFFRQNPDKILVVDFGDATDIGNKFLVPDPIQNLMIVGEHLTSVGDSFLSRRMSLRSLVLPKSLKTVGHSFLFECSSLTSLDLSHLHLKTVGPSFLGGCKALKSLVLPENLTTMADGSLSRCSSLTSLDLLYLPHLKKVGDYFLSSSPLISLVLPKSLTTVGKAFLSGCVSLTSLDLSYLHLKKIGDGFLGGCSSLRSLSLPETLIIVGRLFLRGCSSLTSLDLSRLLHLTTVRDNFLSGCSSLTSLDLSRLLHLKNIGHYFFMGCEALIQLILSPPLASILNIEAIRQENPQLQITIREE